MFGVRSPLVGNHSRQYHYYVKDQWQGRYDNNIQVIGDKKAAQASRILSEPGGMKSLKKLERKLGVQLKFLHVMRNPFDNIATMSLRRADLKKKGQSSLMINDSKTLDGSIASYGHLLRGSYEVKKHFPGRVHDVASGDVMTNTRENTQENL
ncbi:hypothetical protein OS493_027709 [Desmophyllum pertusum]|uniref:Sulfotransferase n=1 Tax=Desmophyllum pertusum TaxID=174260 RepID=A0A9W9Z9S1_9CNID|nr:hypothetical protein OS493_027709 [Desmophyllum pertusum]